ncbi:VOC family protein [Paracraurococcus lichenis]|uniref:Glyoxalase n=1 Tax=Paracraurococcus lichenis TaxID=3064888 RepID=A0ABT9E3B1_9PROT|nr:VOC family protein [Paracraurococcus sp. LOR1-02]MDO9710651.1 glyoxalase [Paracraurococcus sp. LOR1-02]
MSAWRVARISLTSAAPGAAAFYRDALGFEVLGTETRAGEGFAGLMEIPVARARATRLRLGGEEVELLAFDPPGLPYPAERRADDPWFRHFAIVVSDMQAAHARLRGVPGWTAISTGGPQRLPESSGGVTAFKFRDPEGHPLELLEFPPGRVPPAWRGRPTAAGPCLGIDHSAITVTNVAASLGFYGGLGFEAAARTLNHGPEQARLDGLSGARATVVALHQPGVPGPHLELLGYDPPSRAGPPPASNADVAASRLVLEAMASGAAENAPRILRDPDGHCIELHPVPRGTDVSDRKLAW